MATLSGQMNMRLFPLFFLYLIHVPFSFAAVTTETQQDCPRIISQSPYISEMLDYPGMKHCIVGVSRYSKRDL